VRAAARQHRRTPPGEPSGTPELDRPARQDPEADPEGCGDDAVAAAGWRAPVRTALLAGTVA
jgi:hypothetical protein